MAEAAIVVFLFALVSGIVFTLSRFSSNMGSEAELVAATSLTVNELRDRLREDCLPAEAWTLEAGPPTRLVLDNTLDRLGKKVPLVAYTIDPGQRQVVREASGERRPFGFAKGFGKIDSFRLDAAFLDQAGNPTPQTAQAVTFRLELHLRRTSADPEHAFPILIPRRSSFGADGDKNWGGK